MFALVGCNSFYASCEQIFRPNLRNKSVVVLSHNDGDIVARSKEAQMLNVPKLLDFFQIEALLKQQNIHIFSNNYPLYYDVFNRVILTWGQLSPNIDVYSIESKKAFIQCATRTRKQKKQSISRCYAYLSDAVFNHLDSLNVIKHI